MGRTLPGWRGWLVAALLLAPASLGLFAAETWWRGGDSALRAEAPQSADYEILTAYDPAQDYTPAERWQKVVSPELMGWFSEGLAEARARSERLGTSALIIIENGVVVDAWGKLDEHYQSRSMRKSFLSMLFGRLVADGRLKLSDTLETLGIDDNSPLTAEERQATLYDLLTSRSGVYHAANFETSSMRRKRPERGSHPPGSFWFYNNWDFNALGTIYERATGQSVFEAFREEIAEPLQMQHHRPEDTRYFHDEYSEHPAYRFSMQPFDLARIGLLYLREGAWNGRQVVPRDWVALSTEAHVDLDRRGFHAGFGFMWWVGEDGFAAVGARGQRIFVMPERDLVIVHVVDTKDKDRRVRSGDIRGLLATILSAKREMRSQIAPSQGEVLPYAVTTRGIDGRGAYLDEWGCLVDEDCKLLA